MPVLRPGFQQGHPLATEGNVYVSVRRSTKEVRKGMLVRANNARELHTGSSLLDADVSSGSASVRRHRGVVCGALATR